jgi:protein O-GlcNAc transferase
LVKKGHSELHCVSYDKALLSFDEVIKRKPNLTAWTLKGITQYRLKRYEDATSSLNQALKIDTQIADAWSYKGMSEDRLKRPQDAKKSFEYFIAAQRTISQVSDDDYDYARKYLGKLRSKEK